MGIFLDLRSFDLFPFVRGFLDLHS